MKTLSYMTVLFLFMGSSLIIFYAAYYHRATNALLGVFRHTTPVSRGHTIQLDPSRHVQRKPATITHHWNITKDYRSPDGVLKLVYLINGKH